jgi:hypothetical protein
VPGSGRTGWILLFGLGFGWVEAAVVVYLRRIFYPLGFSFPLVPLTGSLLRVELARELATMVMLLSMAGLAGRRRWERFAFFIIAFGVWDLVYYAALKLVLDWPASFGTLDILFLLPLPWIAPVYAPVSIAVLMIAAGLVVLRLEEQGHRCRADLVCWILGAAGTLVLLFSFMRDTAAGLRGAVPLPYASWMLLAGDALLLACIARFVWVSSGRPAGRNETT